MLAIKEIFSWNLNFMRKKITISGVSFFFVTKNILENEMEHVNMRIFLPEMQSFILQIYLVRKLK